MRLNKVNEIMVFGGIFSLFYLHKMFHYCEHFNSVYSFLDKSFHHRFKLFDNINLIRDINQRMTWLWRGDPLYEKFPNLISFKSSTSPSACTNFHITVGHKIDSCKSCICLNNLSECIFSIKLYLSVDFWTEIYCINCNHDWIVIIFQFIIFVWPIIFQVVTVILVVTVPSQTINDYSFVFIHLWCNQHWN